MQICWHTVSLTQEAYDGRLVGILREAVLLQHVDAWSHTLVLREADASLRAQCYNRPSARVFEGSEGSVRRTAALMHCHWPGKYAAINK